jgi:hypothetical protein
MIRRSRRSVEAFAFVEGWDAAEGVARAPVAAAAVAAAVAVRRVRLEVRCGT